MYVNDKKFNLMKRKQVFQFLYYICSTVFNLGEVIAVLSILFGFVGFIRNNISNNLMLIATVDTLISVLASYYGEIFKIKNKVYSEKVTQNLELFGDYIYDAKRISEALRINEDKVKK